MYHIERSRTFVIKKYRKGVKGYMEYFILKDIDLKPVIVHKLTKNNTIEIKLLMRDVPHDETTLYMVQETGEFLANLYLIKMRLNLEIFIKKNPEIMRMSNKLGFGAEDTGSFFWGDFKKFKFFFRKNDFKGKYSILLKKFFNANQFQFIIYKTLLIQSLSLEVKNVNVKYTFSEALSGQELQTFRTVRQQVRYIERQYLISSMNVPPNDVIIYALSEQEIEDAGGYLQAWTKLSHQEKQQYMVLIYEEDRDAFDQNTHDLMREEAKRYYAAYIELFYQFIGPLFMSLHSEITKENFRMDIKSFWPTFQVFTKNLFTENFPIQEMKLFLNKSQFGKNYANNEFALQVFKEYTNESPFTPTILIRFLQEKFQDVTN